MGGWCVWMARVGRLQAGQKDLEQQVVEFEVSVDDVVRVCVVDPREDLVCGMGEKGSVMCTK